MPRITGADLTNVSTQNQPVADGTYPAKIVDTEFDVTNPAKPQVVITSEIDDPESPDHGRKVWDRLYLKKNNGEDNPIAYRQLKRYFEAALGEEAGNQSDPDTDDLKNTTVLLVIKQRQYEKDGEERISADVKNILPYKG